MFKAATFSLDKHLDPFSYMTKIMCEWNVDARSKLFQQILDAERHMTLQFLARLHTEQENG